MNRPRYTLAELLAEVDASGAYPLPPSEREWVDAPAIGRELLAEDLQSAEAIYAYLAHAAAYVLHQQLRTQALRHTTLARAQSATVIAKLFKMAVQVRPFKDRVILHLPTSCPVRSLLHTVTQLSLTAFPMPWVGQALPVA